MAGVAIDAYHTEIWRELLSMEETSGKGKRDWHSTKNFRTRRRYLGSCLAIPQLRGRVFYRVFWDEPDDPWEATVRTLSAAAEHFAEDEHCTLAHEGFTEGSRRKLKHAVRTSSARSKVEVATGSFEQNPMIRLADSLCGLIRVVHSDSERGDRYGDLNHDWFVDLGSRK